MSDIFKEKDDIYTSGEGLKKLLIIVITFLFLMIILFAVFFFTFNYTHGKKADQLVYKCVELSDFVWVKGDESKPLTLPCSINVGADESFVYETVLPDVISDDMWIDYYSGRSTKIYVDGELRKEFNKDENTILGGAVKSIHMFVELYPSDAGKTLTIVRDGNPNNGSNLNRVYIGNSLGIVERIISDNIFYFILTFALMVIAIIAIGIGISIRITQRIQTPITSMGIGVLFMTIWLIFDSELYQLAFRNYYLDGTMSFIMMLILPYPFMYYLDILQEKRYRLMYAFLCLYLQTVTVCSFLLHFSKMADFMIQLPFLAFSIGVVLLGTMATLVIDFIKGNHKSYFISFIGVIGLGVSCVIEIIFIVTVENRYDGSCIIWGLLWTITLAIIHQINEVRQAQKEAAMAVRASETKTNFLANMSHEIRTPMNAILGMDEMILRESKNNPRITKYATDIKSAGNMLLSIINDILDMSKIESGKAELIPVDFEICSVINDLINIVSKRAADKGLEFSFDADANIPIRFHGDEIRTRQIMLNIINNAVKYTEKGSVKVNAYIDEKKNIKEGDIVTLVVSVKDTGIGIKEEDKDKLFKAFDRLEETKNRKIEGTGLGLNIAGNYVELMGGHIDVESEYCVGSTFTIYMPMEVVDATPIGDFSKRISEIHNRDNNSKPLAIAPNASALIVDDNEMNLEVISGLMERTRMKVDLAISGEEGLKKMERIRYDIVFLDQMMPGMDGVATLNAMKSQCDMRGVSVIALTADAVAGAREYYLEKGFNDYLSKPVKAEELENILIKHLPKQLLLTEEDLERVLETEEKRRQEKEKLKTVVVIDSDAEALKEVKEKTDGIYKGTFVTDLNKAKKYLEKHDTDYVLVRKDIFFNEINENSEEGNSEKEVN